MPDCPDLPPLPAHDPTHAATVVWIVVAGAIVAILVVDLVLAASGRRTLSQVAQRYFGRHPALAGVLVVTLGLLAWHLVRGFPW